MGNPTIRTVVAAFLIATFFAVYAAAQPSLSTPGPSNIGSTMSVDVLGDLPTGANFYSVLETTQPEVVTDRFNSGGLNAGGQARVGGFLGSWGQTRYRLGEISITSPNGAPMLFPEIAYWQRINVETALMSPDINAPALAVSLEPHRPSARWTGTVEGFGSSSRFASASASSRAPPISRLVDWAHGSALVSGPLVADRLGVVIGGGWTRNVTLERADSTRLRGRTGSAFAHLVYVRAPCSEVRTVAWLQHVEAPAPRAVRALQPAATMRDRATHLQSTLERHSPDVLAWRVFGAYTERNRKQGRGGSESSDPQRLSGSNSFVVDRLIDGPVPLLVADVGDRTERRWTLGARLSPQTFRRRHTTHFGVDVEGVASEGLGSSASLIGELVDGLPARVWTYASPGVESKRHATTFTAFASDRIAVSARLVIDAALRFESVDGRANGASHGIDWRTLLPNATVRWKIGTPYDLGAVTGYTRSANQLLLDVLAYGDPAAPVASVFRWEVNGSPNPDPQSAALAGTLVARVGPGTGGDPEFSRIERSLKRPHTDEFLIGVDARPRTTLRVGVSGIARRQAALVNAVNVGVPMNRYTTFTVPDANVDLVNSSDDQDLPVYNRLPESFGRDRYLLTNSGQDAATMGAIVVTGQVATERLFLRVGATATAAIGSGGNRGFRAIENDPDIIGELLTNPNASTYARGRLFSDRAYTIKWTTVYRFPKDIRLGVIARYQDGQPFARLVVVPGLNQGAEAIQAFANGRSRFAFTGTLDVRLQKGFALGATRLDTILDAYNLLNMAKEVEEYVVTGDRFRTPTAVQPPRAVHVGVRVRFPQASRP